MTKDIDFKELGIKQTISEYLHKKKGYEETIKQYEGNIDTEDKTLERILSRYLELSEDDYIAVSEEYTVEIVMTNSITTEFIDLVEGLGREYEIDAAGVLELTIYLNRKRIRKFSKSS